MTIVDTVGVRQVGATLSPAQAEVLLGSHLGTGGGGGAGAGAGAGAGVVKDTRTVRVYRYPRLLPFLTALIRMWIRTGGLAADSTVDFKMLWDLTDCKDLMDAVFE